MNRGVFFKPVSESDFEDILKLEEESFNSYDRLDRDTLIELFSEFPGGFYSINSEEMMIGYSVFLIEDGCGYIESIAINSRWRRRGLGLLALRFMIKCIMEMGIQEINLHVRIDNTAAMALYEKEGFVKKNIVAGFYKDGEPAYLYSVNAAALSKIITGVN